MLSGVHHWKIFSFYNPEEDHNLLQVKLWLVKRFFYIIWPSIRYVRTNFYFSWLHLALHHHYIITSILLWAWFQSPYHFFNNTIFYFYFVLHGYKQHVLLISVLRNPQVPLGNVWIHFLFLKKWVKKRIIILYSKTSSTWSWQRYPVKKPICYINHSNNTSVMKLWPTAPTGVRRTRMEPKVRVWRHTCAFAISSLIALQYWFILTPQSCSLYCSRIYFCDFF